MDGGEEGGGGGGYAHKVMHGLPWSAQGTKKFLFRFFYPLPLQKFSFISPTPRGRETTLAFKLPARPIIWEFIDVIVV